MTDEFGHFCPACGAGISESDTFCPTCGAGIDRGAGTATPNAYRSPQYQDQNRGGSLTIATALSILWAVLGILIGIAFVVSVDYFIDIVQESGIYPDLDFGALRDLLVVDGYLLIASGAVAGVAGFLLIVRKYWQIAVILIIASTALAFYPLSFLAIVGLIVAYLVYSSRSRFFTA